MEKRKLEILIENQIINGIIDYFDEISDLRISAYGDSAVYEEVIVIPNLTFSIQYSTKLLIDDIVKDLIRDIKNNVQTFNKGNTKLYVGNISLEDDFISVKYGFKNL